MAQSWLNLEKRGAPLQRVHKTVFLFYSIYKYSAFRGLYELIFIKVMHKNILECSGMQENFENEKVCLIPIPYVFTSPLNNLRLFPKIVYGKLD